MQPTTAESQTDSADLGHKRYLPVSNLADLIELDQSTVANMTAALDFVCKQIPAERDTSDIRRQIADEMIARANAGRRTYIDFQVAGEKRLAKLIKKQRYRWLSWLFLRPEGSSDALKTSETGE